MISGWAMMILGICIGIVIGAGATVFAAMSDFKEQEKQKKIVYDFFEHEIKDIKTQINEIKGEQNVC